MPDGVNIPGGPSFGGHPQPPDVPCDPTGEDWRGPPGPQGPPGDMAEAPVDGTAYGRLNAAWVHVVPTSQLGTAIGQVPVFINSQGSGFPGLNLSDRTILRRPTTTATDYADIQLSRVTTFNAGTPGTAANNAALRVLGNYGANDKTNEWNIISTATTAGTGGGTAVGVFSQAIRSVGATDPIWAGIADAMDTNGTASSVSGGSVVGMEIDVEANKADDGTNPSSWGGVGLRKGIDIVAVRKNLADTTPYEVSHGVWFTAGTFGATATDAYTNYQSAIGFGVNTQVRNALDTRGAITPTGSSNPVSAVTMSAGHIIDLNGGPALNSAPGNYLQYRSGKLYYVVGGVDKWSVDASGNMRCAGTVTPSVIP